MDRTFHHRFTVGAACGIILFLLLAAYFFWVKRPVLGCLMALALVVVAERSLHKEYIFRGGNLIIYNGRLAKTKSIPLDKITSCRTMTNVFGLVHYILVTYDEGRRMESLQPDNERAFIECLKKRKNGEILQGHDF